MQGLSLTQDQIEQFLGTRGEHYHGGKGDAGCFSVCPVWSWDRRAHALQIFILDQKIELAQTIQNQMKASFSVANDQLLDGLQSVRAKFGN